LSDRSLLVRHVAALRRCEPELIQRAQKVISRDTAWIGY
jgi:hypothetical protein